MENTRIFRLPWARRRNIALSVFGLGLMLLVSACSSSTSSTTPGGTAAPTSEEDNGGIDQTPAYIIVESDGLAMPDLRSLVGYSDLVIVGSVSSQSRQPQLEDETGRNAGVVQQVEVSSVVLGDASLAGQSIPVVSFGLNSDYTDVQTVLGSDEGLVSLDPALFGALPGDGVELLLFLRQPFAQRSGAAAGAWELAIAAQSLWIVDQSDGRIRIPGPDDVVSTDGALLDVEGTIVVENEYAEEIGLDGQLLSDGIASIVAEAGAFSPRGAPEGNEAISISIEHSPGVVTAVIEGGAARNEVYVGICSSESHADRPCLLESFRLVELDESGAGALDFAVADYDLDQCSDGCRVVAASRTALYSDTQFVLPG